jgi:hypothetical protein
MMVDTRGTVERRRDELFEERRLKAIAAADEAQEALRRALDYEFNDNPCNPDASRLSREINALVEARVKAVLRECRLDRMRS